jgi:pilus assembly protein CpaE
MHHAKSPTPPGDPLSGGASRKTGPTAMVFVSDQDAERVIRRSLTDLGVHDAEYTPGNVQTATAVLAKQPSPRLLIVDISDAEDPVNAIQMLSEVCEPNVGVIAVGVFNDIVLYRSLKETGIVEYFFKPLVRDLLVQVCDSVIANRKDRQGANLGKLVFVMGVRGGVGTSTIAANAVWRLSEVWQRWTMLLDLNTENGDAALQLDVTPGHALREAFQHPERVDRLFLDRGAIHVTKRLDALASLDPLGVSGAFNQEAIPALLKILLQRYRFVFVDLPFRIAIAAPPLFQMSSTWLLISSSSLASARDMARWRAHIGANTLKRRMLHVLNHTSAYGGLPESEFVRACGQAPDLIIPYDRGLAEASSFGISAMQKCTTFNRNLTTILYELVGEPVKTSESFLKRMFG